MNHLLTLWALTRRFYVGDPCHPDALCRNAFVVSGNSLGASIPRNESSKSTIFSYLTLATLGFILLQKVIDRQRKSKMNHNMLWL